MYLSLSLSLSLSHSHSLSRPKWEFFLSRVHQLAPSYDSHNATRAHCTSAYTHISNLVSSYSTILYNDRISRSYTKIDKSVRGIQISTQVASDIFAMIVSEAFQSNSIE